jgi:hypothetical protein
MDIAGVSIILILGLINFFLLLFQLFSGLHWIKVKFGIHRKTGILLFVLAAIHGLLGLLANL